MIQLEIFSALGYTMELVTKTAFYFKLWVQFDAYTNLGHKVKKLNWLIPHLIIVLLWY